MTAVDALAPAPPDVIGTMAGIATMVGTETTAETETTIVVTEEEAATTDATAPAPETAVANRRPVAMISSDCRSQYSIGVQHSRIPPLVSLVPSCHPALNVLPWFVVDNPLAV